MSDMSHWPFLGSWPGGYSAGQLSPNVFESTILLAVADIFGYIVALSADVLGRNKAMG